ncbi:glycosyltransferase family 2 protein [Flavitalea sp.]|nr:glycosyltransferase family 2 protein [Flavitalea sp.]
MVLSVLIVNYNVRYFLEHCLLSVLQSIEYMKSAEGWQTEVLVIDNDSHDNSLEYLQPLFPSVRFVQASKNLGFGKANNLILKEASGKYVLFLNPDTLVAQDCFLKTIRFMESTPLAGACGVRMIDGSGNFLPESKRGFPGAWNSFSKMTGLIKIFPRSSVFAGYYEGHLDELKTQEVSILSGAWMMVRSSVLDKTGGFDERFFMYAEDIDLSYRIKLEGFANYYFAETTIVHFKGESTSKDKIYTSRFYTAMIRFVQKHFTGAAASLYIVMLRAMIKFKTLAPGMGQELQPMVTGSSLKTFATGDPGAIRVLSAIIKRSPGSVKVFSDEKQTADEIVFCLGDNFSVTDLVKRLESEYCPVKKIFHPRAGAIIGSHSKNNQGSVEVLHR